MNPDPKWFCVFADRCKVKSNEECLKCLDAWLVLVEERYPGLGEYRGLFQKDLHSFND